MAAAPTGRLHRELTTLAGRGYGVRDFAAGAAHVLRHVVGFDGFCLITLDPASRIPTGEVVEDALPSEATLRMTEIELRGEDVNRFDALARTGSHVAGLAEATGGRLERSSRHREVRAAHGFGDELRAALVDGGAAWGGLTLLRRADRDHFSPADTRTLAAVVPHLAEGLRRAVLRTTGPGPARESPGLLLLARDGELEECNQAGEAWLAALGADAGLPAVVTGVAVRARHLGDARARVQSASGTWLLVRGTALGDRTAVVIEQAGSHDLAGFAADGYDLTPRERAVAQLVAGGLPTDAIARRLHLSPWTVQDHLKSIFAKVGVATRGELVARLYFAHDVPALGG
jgi:DNA-binding CsgD family transcriptional regulator